MFALTDVLAMDNAKEESATVNLPIQIMTAAPVGHPFITSSPLSLPYTTKSDHTHLPSPLKISVSEEIEIASSIEVSGVVHAAQWNFYHIDVLSTNALHVKVCHSHNPYPTLTTCTIHTPHYRSPNSTQ